MLRADEVKARVAGRAASHWHALSIPQTASRPASQQGGRGLYPMTLNAKEDE